MRAVNGNGTQLAKSKVALKELFDQYYFPLCSYAYRYVSNQNLVDDIVQEAFIQIWQHPGEFENRAAIKAFLYLCVRNSCLNHLKHKKIEVKNQKAIVDIFSFDSEDEELQIYENELHARLHEAILKLPQQSRFVIQYSLDGLDNTSIADKMGITLNSVKTLKKRAYHILREELGHFRWILLLFPI